MYSIITSQYQVVTIYAPSLKDALEQAHDAELKVLSITELKDCDL